MSPPPTRALAVAALAFAAGCVTKPLNRARHGLREMPAALPDRPARRVRPRRRPLRRGRRAVTDGEPLPQLVFVLGKGGVGRSTVATALALAAARGDRALVVQWTVRDGISPWFGLPPVGHAATRASDERVRVEQTLRRLGAQIDRLLDAYQEGALTVAELKARRERLEAAREAARTRHETLVAHELDAERLDDLASDLEAFAATLRAGLDELDFAGRQRLDGCSSSASS